MTNKNSFEAEILFRYTTVVPSAAAEAQAVQVGLM